MTLTRETAILNLERKNLANYSNEKFIYGSACIFVIITVLNKRSFYYAFGLYARYYNKI